MRVNGLLAFRLGKDDNQTPKVRETTVLLTPIPETFPLLADSSPGNSKKVQGLFRPDLRLQRFYYFHIEPGGEGLVRRGPDI